MPKDVNKTAIESQQIMLSSSTLAKLQNACDYRKEAAEKVFQSEFTGVPEALAKDGKLFHSNKADLLEVFKSTATPPTVINAHVIDLSGIIRQLSSINLFINSCNTLNEFVDCVISYIQNNFFGDRIDIIADRYFEGSVKVQTWERRGIGI